MATTRAITITNVPADVGSAIKGKHLAPDAIHSVSLPKKLENVGYDVKEQNALLNGPKIWSSEATWEPNGARNEKENVEVNTDVKRSVLQALNDATSPFQLVIGGECSMVPAIMSALWEHYSPKKVGLLYIDADADLAIPGEPGSSGNVASQTMTHLTLRPGALDSMKPFSRPDGSGVVDSSNFVLFGLNSAIQSNSRSQLSYLFDEGYRVMTSSAVAKDPIGRAKLALAYLEERVDIILVHLDVDAIDGDTFPLANLVNRTGVDFEKHMQAMKIFLASKKVQGLSVAEVNPDHDPGLKMTTRLVDGLVAAFKERFEVV